MVGIYKIDVRNIILKGQNSKKKVKAKRLFNYWAVRELRISLTELGRRLGISIARVGYSVERGEVIGRGNDYKLLE